jgi:general secretion pathway protein G
MKKLAKIQCFRSSKGFTLIELLAVVAIIAIISAIAVPQFIKVLDVSKDKKVLTDMRNFAIAIGLYSIDTGIVPYAGNASQLVAVLKQYEGRDVGFLTPRDSWGREFDYYRASDTEYTLKSYGKDGMPGNPANPEYFDANADTIVISGRFVACHEGATAILR